MPPEKELDRQIHVIIGAGAGIGKETAHRIVKEGAHVVCVDKDEAAAKATADEIIAKYGAGIGVAGTGISNCGVSIGLGCDMTDRESVARMFEQVILAFGGIDAVIVTAGVFVPPDKTGHIDDQMWDFTFGINVKGAYIVADEANQILKKQGLKGNIILTTSANAVVAKKGSLAYDTSKAAANHLVRELAVEMSPLVRVNAVAPATVVKGSTMFPRDRVIASLAKYEIPFDESEETDGLTEKLSNFYAKRSLTQIPIEPSDQAEAIFLLLSKRLEKTTGHIIPVDGGLQDGFMR
jgi:NAD(P)-dependent dehydrogenase (short-subunit alcohol dehydrogenase family)